MARKKEQEKTDQRLLHERERLSNLLEDILEQADGLNTSFTVFTTDEKNRIDSNRTLETAKKILTFSAEAQMSARKRELYINYLYCYMITASIPYTAYGLSEQEDLRYGTGTFRHLLDETLGLYPGIYGMQLFHTIVFHGNALLKLLTGRGGKYVVPVDDWPEAQAAISEYHDEVYDGDTGMSEEELARWNEFNPEDRDYETGRMDDETELLQKQEGERLRLKFPDYKEYEKRMKKLDKQQHEMDGGFSERIGQMVRAFLRAEGYTLYDDEEHYVEIMVYLRRVFKACGGTIE